MSIAIPATVLIAQIALAPAFSQPKAISAMFEACGVSFAIKGIPEISFLTAAGPDN